MIKIKFNDSDIFHEVEFSRTENTVTLKGITEQNSSGFTTYRMSGEQLGDFSDFTTVFKVENDSITYSNDGSVYVEPIQPTEKELQKQEQLQLQEELCFSMTYLPFALPPNGIFLVKCSIYGTSRLQISIEKDTPSGYPQNFLIMKVMIPARIQKTTLPFMCNGVDE